MIRIFIEYMKCMPYTRTATSPRENCSLGFREQANQATSYLDASHIYGSTTDQAKVLRVFERGYLNYTQNAVINIFCEILSEIF